jgi:hypothetical protein
VLKTILGRSTGSGEDDGPPGANAAGGLVDRERLKTLVDFFPIGKKLRYYPEFKKEIFSTRSSWAIASMRSLSTPLKG